MRLADTLDRLAELVAARDAERRALPPEPETARARAERLMEPRPAEGALQAFLRSLSPPTLLAVAALMYAGRDRDDDVEDVAEYVLRRGLLEGVPVLMAGQIRPCEYVQRGVEYVGRDRLDELTARCASMMKSPGRPGG